jgi:general secretion pathway protein C
VTAVAASASVPSSMLAAPLALLLALADAPAAAPKDIAVAGVVVGTTPDRSSAILVSGGRTRVVAVGEAAFGGRLVAVAKDSVTLEFGGQRLELRLPAAGAAPAPAPARPATGSLVLPPGAPPEDPQTPPREMSRVEVQRRLAEEIPRILAETAVAPVLEEGRVVGVQITRMPEGTLLSDAGLRAGDVLTRINGTDIDGMATLIGLWPRLQSATELRATVLRNGQPFSLSVALR